MNHAARNINAEKAEALGFPADSRVQWQGRDEILTGTVVGATKSVDMLLVRVDGTRISGKFYPDSLTAI